MYGMYVVYMHRSFEISTLIHACSHIHGAGHAAQNLFYYMYVCVNFLVLKVHHTVS